MQIKTTREYHLAAIRRVILKKKKKKQKITSAEEPCTLLVGLHNGAAAMENHS